MKVLIVPDKFKGSLTAQQAAQAIQRGWLSTRPTDALELLPMSDGGDGFGEIISQLVGAQVQPIKTLDAAHRPCDASWWWLESAQMAIIESARVIGLALLPPGMYHPFKLDTYGLGALLEAAAGKGVKACLIGIGGSATNDGGFGMARALGWQFLDAGRKRIEQWTNLGQLAEVCPPENSLCPEKVTVAVDVQNPLLGPTGCARVYGPQKGLRPEDFALAENCLGQLAKVVQKQFGQPGAEEPGAGAAGGLGFGLRCFASTRLEPGFDLFSRYAKLENRIKSADLVITGEGAIDHSTLMGKGVGEIAAICRRQQLPCIGLAGVVPNLEEAQAAFTEVHSLVPKITSTQEAMLQAELWLERLAAWTARSFQKGNRGAKALGY